MNIVLRKLLDLASLQCPIVQYGVKCVRSVFLAICTC